MEKGIQKLKGLLAEVVDLQRSAAVLAWEQQTYMPPGGASARAEQLATLGGLAHRMFVTDEIGGLLAELEQSAGDWGYDSDEACLLRFIKRRYERERRIPTDLVAELARTTAIAQEVWVQARKAADYPMFKPYLRDVLSLRRQQAECLAPYDHIYDPLLDEYEPEMKTAEVRAMFASIKDDLVELVGTISERADAVRDEALHGDFDIERQRVFGLEVAQKFGYDLERGRQDEAPHPFCTHFSSDDVRITTRFDPTFLPSALFGTLHETGHALYEQGVDPRLARSGMDTGISLGGHESQSRLCENLIGRSRPFWRYFFPQLQAVFPDALANLDLESFYRAINRSAPSLIRVEADEVTYNLHVIIRFELELDLLTGMLDIDELPGAWNEKYQRYLGISPENDAEGVLQDIHWSMGAIGYFATYSIGNLLSVQLFNCAREALPNLDADIAAGDFDSLLGWLRDNIHHHGSKFTPRELVQRVTGGDMDARPYMAYLREKYSDIYDL